MSDRLGSWFGELRRRNVVRVAGMYLAGAWLLAQVATQVLPVFEVSPWVLRAVIVLLALGFPLALVAAWVYELTPAGLRRTDAVVPEASITRHTGRRIDRSMIILLSLALGYFMVDKFYLRDDVARTLAERSIAVLPFENASAAVEDAYFADGLRQRILEQLARVDDLRVVPATSTADYASHPDNLGPIGTDLGVAQVLEGSVKRSGDSVVVEVTLLGTRDSASRWHETFQRPLADLVQLERDVAQQVADALHARLSPVEKQALSALPTRNAQAYQAYLKGIAVTTTISSNTTLRDSRRHFALATQLDPAFWQAWAQLSQVDSALCGGHFDRTPELMREAATATERAVALAPERVESHLARRRYLGYCLGDGAGARAAFARALELEPGHLDVLKLRAMSLQAAGDFIAAQALLEQAAGRDPRNVDRQFTLALSYAMSGRFDQSLRAIERALAIRPDEPDIVGFQIALHHARGELDAAAAVLAPLPQQSNVSPNLFEFQILQWLYEGRPREAVDALRVALLRPDRKLGFFISEYRVFLGLAERWAGHAVASRKTFLVARDELLRQSQVEADNANVWINLALAQAALGEAEPALAAITRAQTVSGGEITPEVIEARAKVHALTGNTIAAVSDLRELFGMSYLGYYGTPITPAHLQLDPIWRALANDAGFKALLAEGRRPTVRVVD
jgi:TolB-like protein/cytochrome c-type biogenesis protein CcmH/NrfG